MAIYLTGDIHQSIDITKLSFGQWPESKHLTRSDVLIILGDFGFPFHPEDRALRPPKQEGQKPIPLHRDYWHWIRWLGERPYTILWIDGNHENHAFWREQPVIQWQGGRVQPHPDADNILHLMRGEVYTLEGKTFWCMGGAQSTDRQRRKEGVSWWPEEIPSQEEMTHGLATLEQRGWRVDYILTHTMPDHLIAQVTGEKRGEDPTAHYLDEVWRRTQLAHWYCGHFHIDKTDEAQRLTVLNERITRVV